MKLSQGGKKSEKRKKEEEEDEERRKVTQRRRLAPASPAVGNPGSSIEPGRRYVRTERERDRIGRERESLPLSRRGKFTGKISGKLEGRSQRLASLYPHHAVHTMSQQSRPRLLRCRGGSVFGQPWPRSAVGMGGRGAAVGEPSSGSALPPPPPPSPRAPSLPSSRREQTAQHPRH